MAKPWQPKAPLTPGSAFLPLIPPLELPRVNRIGMFFSSALLLW
jgi:hypothetical protein